MLNVLLKAANKTHYIKAQAWNISTDIEKWKLEWKMFPLYLLCALNLYFSIYSMTLVMKWADIFYYTPDLSDATIQIWVQTSNIITSFTVWFILLGFNWHNRWKFKFSQSQTWMLRNCLILFVLATSHSFVSSNPTKETARFDINVILSILIKYLPWWQEGFLARQRVDPAVRPAQTQDLGAFAIQTTRWHSETFKNNDFRARSKAHIKHYNTVIRQLVGEVILWNLRPIYAADLWGCSTYRCWYESICRVASQWWITLSKWPTSSPAALVSTPGGQRKITAATEHTQAPC